MDLKSIYNKLVYYCEDAVESFLYLMSPNEGDTPRETFFLKKDKMSYIYERRLRKDENALFFPNADQNEEKLYNALVKDTSFLEDIYRDLQNKLKEIGVSHNVITEGDYERLVFYRKQQDRNMEDSAKNKMKASGLINFDPDDSEVLRNLEPEDIERIKNKMNNLFLARAYENNMYLLDLHEKDINTMDKISDDSIFYIINAYLKYKKDSFLSKIIINEEILDFYLPQTEGIHSYLTKTNMNKQDIINALDQEFEKSKLHLLRNYQSIMITSKNPKNESRNFIPPDKEF